MLGTRRSGEQAASLPSTDRAGRLQDPQAAGELLGLFPSLGQQAMVPRDQESSQAVRWGWWLLSCALGVAMCFQKRCGMWFNDGLGRAELVVGLGDLGGVFHLRVLILWWQCGTCCRTEASWATWNLGPHLLGHCGASGVIQPFFGLFLGLVWDSWGCPMPGQELDFDGPYGSLPTGDII